MIRLVCAMVVIAGCASPIDGFVDEQKMFDGHLTGSELDDVAELDARMWDLGGVSCSDCDLLLEILRSRNRRIAILRMSPVSSGHYSFAGIEEGALTVGDFSHRMVARVTDLSGNEILSSDLEPAADPLKVSTPVQDWVSGGKVVVWGQGSVDRSVRVTHHCPFLRFGIQDRLERERGSASNATESQAGTAILVGRTGQEVVVFANSGSETAFTQTLGTATSAVEIPRSACAVDIKLMSVEKKHERRYTPSSLRATARRLLVSGESIEVSVTDLDSEGTLLFPWAYPTYDINSLVFELLDDEGQVFVECTHEFPVLAGDPDQPQTRELIVHCGVQARIQLQLTQSVPGASSGDWQ